MELEFKLDLPKESDLKPGEEQGRLFDLAILGGGAAGMTAAVYASRKQMNTVLISPDLGGQILATSGVENYMGFQYIDGPELSRKFSEQLQQFPLKMVQGEKIVEVGQGADGLFTVRTDAGREILSRTLILATGKRWRTLGVPGEDKYFGQGVARIALCVMPLFLKVCRWR